MDIINKINIQLSKIKSILVKELKQGEYTYDYKICEDECKFLDKPELQSYLSETQISNTFFLKIINELCSYIIDIWNDDFQKLDRKMLKEGPHPLYKGMHKIRISLLDFHGLDVFEDEIIHYNTISEKITFAVKYNILDNALLYINIKLIADRCSIILDLISAAYPETTANRLVKSNNEKYKEYAWFEVGLLFANGEMEELILKHSSNATQIAKKVFGDEWNKYRPCISDSIGNITKRDKNIFADNSKLLKIEKHCLENNISISSAFSNQIKTE